MRIEEKDNRETTICECTVKDAEKWCKDNGREIVEVRANRKGTFFVTMPAFRSKLDEFYKKGGANDRR